jgi:tRNA-specific adenosine deaminase 3
VEDVAAGGCAIIVNSTTNQIVSTSRSEQAKLEVGVGIDVLRNPLQTSVLLAIQGVARLERQAAMTAGGVGTETFATGQYLCTGFDIYVYKEPDFYEAMALLHSRVRRIVFVENDTVGGGLGGGTELERSVHSLKGTNHHFRVFRAKAAYGDGV